MVPLRASTVRVVSTSTVQSSILATTALSQTRRTLAGVLTLSVSSGHKTVLDARLATATHSTANRAHGLTMALAASRVELGGRPGRAAPSFKRGAVVRTAAISFGASLVTAIIMHAQWIVWYLAGRLGAHAHTAVAKARRAARVMLKSTWHTVAWHARTCLKLSLATSFFVLLTAL